MIAQNIQGINNATNTKGVVLENIHTPPPPPHPPKEGNGNSAGRGNPKKGNFSGDGGYLQRFFPGGLSKIGETAY